MNLYKRYPSRWIIMASCLMLMSLSGTVYAFGLISDSIKSRLNLTQTQVDIVATMGGIGQYTYIIGGIFMNRYGPTKAIWIGMILTVGGWTLLTLMTAQIIHTSSPYMIGTANLIYNQGNAWLAGVAAPTLVQNFPISDHGKLLGLAKAYLGTSAAWISIWKTDLANGNINVFMFAFLFSLPIFIIIFGKFMVNIPKQSALKYNENEMGTNCCRKQEDKIKPNFNLWYSILVILAIYLVTMAVLQDIYSFNFYIRVTLFVITILLWLTPWILAIFCHGPITIKFDENMDKNNIEYNIQNEVKKEDDQKKHVGMPTIFKTLEFWMLYIIFAIVCGSGLTYINNIAQIVESASETSVDQDIENKNVSTALVTIISIGNLSGRLCVGIISDKLKHKYHRVNWAMFSSSVMCITHIYLFFIGTRINLLFPGSFLIGIGYGSMISIGIMSCNDLWGTTYLAGNYAALDTAVIVGSTIFATLIFGDIYGYRGKHQENDGNKCFGDNCYKWAFLICSASCSIAFILAFVLSKFINNKQKQEKHNKTKQKLIQQ